MGSHTAGSHTDLLVRRARPADLCRVVELEGLCLGDDGWSEQSWREEFEADARHLIVAVRGPRIVGYASLLHGLDVSEVLRVGVEPARRRAGIGRALLSELVGIARASDVPELMLEVRASNDPAFKLYTTFGFVEIARRGGYYRDGDDALVMRLRFRTPELADPVVEPAVRTAAAPPRS